MMRRALVLAAVTALALARPEMYKEKEDFQYSRSSSDEGTKSGFYGAQRGNMGGNYERAHNMDLLAQHQMGGLVRTVEGELGDGAKQKSGSVFSAASSRGVYGSGHYDLSNLEGRNFQEGTSFGDSQSHSSLSSHQAGYGSQSYRHSAAANSAYGSQSQSSRYNGYQASGNADQSLYANNVQSGANLQSASDYEREQSLAHSTGYNSQSGYQGQSVYDQAASQHSSNAYGSSNARGSHYRLVGASPVRVYVRPGSTVTIPVAAQSFDDTQKSASSFDQNSLTSEVEALKPTGEAKHYESSYRYRKEWEKHDTAPVTLAPLAIPTINPYPANSELYEDAQGQGSEHHEASAQEARNAHSSSQYKGYHVKSGSSRHHSYDQSLSQVNQAGSSTYAQSASDAASVAASGANTHGAYNYGASNLNAANLNSDVENFASKPKSYQSSYSYHKSWERQGDPYVIYPSNNGLSASADSQTSQRLTSSTNHASGYGSHQYGSYHQGHGYAADCDENGHIRVARSTRHQERSSQLSEDSEDVGQHSKKFNRDFEEFGQELQNFGNDFGQQANSFGDQFGQQAHSFGSETNKNLESFGQQMQGFGNQFGQQAEKLEDLGQHSETLEVTGQQSQNLEDFGQGLDSFGQNLEQQLQDLGQQTQNQWDQQTQTDAGQETQSTWDMFQPLPENSPSAQKPDTFGISQPTEYRPFQPEDQRKPFSFGQTNENHLGRDTTLENNKDIMQSEDVDHTGKHTYYWQSFQRNTNQNGQSAYVPVMPYNHNSEPDWQKYLEDHNIHINTGYGQHHHQHSAGFSGNSWVVNQKPFVNTGYNTNPRAYPDYSYSYVNHPHTGYGHTYTNTQYYNTPSESVNTYTQTYINHKNHSTYETVNITDSDSGLSNLWNFLDDTEKETLPATEKQNAGNQYSKENEIKNIDTNFDQTQVQENTFNKIHSKTEKEDIGTFDQTHSFNENSIDKSTDNVQKTESTTESITITTRKQTHEVVLPHNVEREDVAPEKLKPQEEPGRGDIGPENSSEEDTYILSSKPLDIFGTEPTKRTPYKTPDEIESLSLSKDQDKQGIENANAVVEKDSKLSKQDEQNTILTVISLKDQNNDNSSKLQPTTTPKISHGYNKPGVQLDVSRTTSTTPRYYHGYEHTYFGVEKENQQTTEQQSENREQIEIQQSYNQFESFDQQNQQNVEQQLSDFGQQQGDFDQNLSDFGQQPGDFGQQLSDFGQQPGEFGQELADLGQKTDEFGQELTDFGQKPGDFGQQLSDFSQQSGDFGQQSSDFGQVPADFDQKPGEFGQQLSDFGQQTEQKEQKLETYDENMFNTDQQDVNKKLTESEDILKNKQQNAEELEILSQQNQGLNQEIFNQFEDLGQQTQDFGQETQQLSENFGQQNEGFHQDSIGDYSPHEQFQQESIPSFDQQHGNFDIEPKEHGQETENLEQQSQSGDLWQPEEQQIASQVEVFDPPSNKEGRTPVEREPVVEPQIVSKKTVNVDSPPEQTNEKPGFWSKVGSKFSNAKDKVKSWFSSS